MSFWAKAKENYWRSRRAVWRGRAFMIGFIFAGAGGYGLYSDVNHQIHGRPATATLVEHIAHCTVQYKPVGEEKRKEQWPCEQAEDFRRRMGSDKVKLSYDNIARVQFRLDGGRLQEANVDEFKLGSSKLAIGSTLPVIYAPDNPADVRSVMSWDKLKIQLIMLAIGIPCLLLSFGIPLGAFFGRMFRGRDEETVSTTPDYLAPATPVYERADSDMVQRTPVAQTAANTYSRPTGTAPRASFGRRNR